MFILIKFNENNEELTSSLCSAIRKILSEAYVKKSPLMCWNWITNPLGNHIFPIEIIKSKKTQ